MMVDGTRGLASADFTTRATRRVKGTTTKLVIIRPYFFVASKKKTAAAMRRCRLGLLGPCRGCSTGHFPTIKRQRCVLLSYPAQKAVNSHIRKIKKKALGRKIATGKFSRSLQDSISVHCVSGSILQSLGSTSSSIRSYNRYSLFLFVFVRILNE